MTSTSCYATRNIKSARLERAANLTPLPGGNRGPQVRITGDAAPRGARDGAGSAPCGALRIFRPTSRRPGPAPKRGATVQSQECPNTGQCKEATISEIKHLRVAAPAAPIAVNRTVPPRRLSNATLRSREHLTPDEVERLVTAATDKSNHVARAAAHRQAP